MKEEANAASVHVWPLRLPEHRVVLVSGLNSFSTVLR